MMRARNYYYRKVKRSKLEEAWVQYRSLRNLATKWSRREQLKFFEDVSEEAMKKPRKAWKELNRLLGRGKRKKIEVVRTGEGVITDKKGIADEFCMLSRYGVREGKLRERKQRVCVGDEFSA